MSGTQNDEEGTGIYGSDFEIDTPLLIISLGVFISILVLVLFGS